MASPVWTHCPLSTLVKHKQEMDPPISPSPLLRLPLCGHLMGLRRRWTCCAMECHCDQELRGLWYHSKGAGFYYSLGSLLTVGGLGETSLLACYWRETSFTGLYFRNQQYQDLVLAFRSMSESHRVDFFYLHKAALCQWVHEWLYIPVTSFNSFLVSCAFDVFSILLFPFCLLFELIWHLYSFLIICHVNAFKKKEFIWHLYIKDLLTEPHWTQINISFFYRHPLIFYRLVTVSSYLFL